MLGSDLVGFHTEGYAENFRESARDLLGATIDGDAIHLARAGRSGRRPTRSGSTWPHFEALAEQAQADAAALQGASWAAAGSSSGIDRLDYTKGLLLRLDAYERFLELYPELHGTVALYQVATPSRTGRAGLRPAQARRRGGGRPHQRALFRGRLGARSATATARSTRRELAVMYAAADVAFVTPLRDGMNLVAHEFVAINAVAGIDPGVLVLSELTGAADYLARRGRSSSTPTTPRAWPGRSTRRSSSPRPSAASGSSGCTRAVGRLDVHDWADHFLATLSETETATAD